MPAVYRRHAFRRGERRRRRHGRMRRTEWPRDRQYEDARAADLRLLRDRPQCRQARHLHQGVASSWRGHGPGGWTVKVLIVEDDPLHRSYLNEAVRAALPECEMVRSEEHTSELQSLMRKSYAVFCLKKKTN